MLGTPSPAKHSLIFRPLRGVYTFPGMHSANAPLATGVTTEQLLKCSENIITNICSGKAFSDSVCAFQATQQRERSHPLLHAELFRSQRAEVALALEGLILSNTHHTITILIPLLRCWLEFLSNSCGFSICDREFNWCSSAVLSSWSVLKGLPGSQLSVKTGGDPQQLVHRSWWSYPLCSCFAKAYCCGQTWCFSFSCAFWTGYFPWATHVWRKACGSFSWGLKYRPENTQPEIQQPHNKSALIQFK